MWEGRIFSAAATMAVWEKVWACRSHLPSERESAEKTRGISFTFVVLTSFLYCGKFKKMPLRNGGRISDDRSTSEKENPDIGIASKAD